ncbi:MAG TPA: dihydroneopterin aldolase [Polyangiaceae bacterium]
MSANEISVCGRDSITIEGLELECIIGLFEFERVTPQRLQVEATLFVDTRSAALENRLELSVDYEWVLMQIVFILKLGRFELLEAAAHTICRTLLLPPVDGELRARIQAVELSLRKPRALGGRGVPRLRVTRTPDDFASRIEQRPFGSVDVIHETKDVGFYRLLVLPGRQIAWHRHAQMREAELVLTSGIQCQGQPAERGSLRQWPLDLPHYYANPTDRVQSILCIDRPAFIEADEIATPSSSVGGSPSQSFEAPTSLAVQQVWDL